MDGQQKLKITMIGNVGDINKIEGLEFYLFDENEKIGKIILNNFEDSLIIDSNNYDILEKKDNPIINQNNSVFLRSFFIDFKFRNLGFGKKLMKHILEYVKINNVKYVFLICDKSNSVAMKLYTELDFNYYGENDSHVLLIKDNKSI